MSLYLGRAAGHQSNNSVACAQKSCVTQRMRPLVPGHQLRHLLAGFGTAVVSALPSRAGSGAVGCLSCGDAGMPRQFVTLSRVIEPGVSRTSNPSGSRTVAMVMGPPGVG